MMNKKIVSLISVGLVACSFAAYATSPLQQIVLPATVNFKTSVADSPDLFQQDVQQNFNITADLSWNPISECYNKQYKLTYLIYRGAVDQTIYGTYRPSDNGESGCWIDVQSKQAMKYVGTGWDGPEWSVGKNQQVSCKGGDPSYPANCAAQSLLLPSQ